MAKRVFAFPNSAWAGTAHGAAATSWMGLKGANATQIIDCLEFMISGTAGAQAVGGFTTAYSSTLAAATLSVGAAGSDGPMVVNATALSATVIPHTASTTTGPTPSSAAALPKLNLGLNVFGGIIRWNAAPTQQWTMIGNLANGGETVLWNNTTFQGALTGVSANAHIIYEPY